MTDLTPQPAPKKQRRWILPVATGLAGLFIGVGVGGSDDGSAPVSEPETVTKTVTETPEPVTKTETPQACLDALDHADKAFGVASKQMSVSGEVFQAIGDLDFEHIQGLMQKFEGYTDDLNALAPQYNAAKAECRAQ